MTDSSYRESLITVAKLYYMGNMSQEAIGKLMGLSRPKVSRMLNSARQMQIVRFDISTPPSHYTSLATKIKSHYGLNEVMVLPSESTKEMSKHGVAKAAAHYLEGIIKDGFIIGIAWGSTISYIPKYLTKSTKQNGSIWQLTAGYPSQSLELDGHEITKRFAEKLNATFHVLNAPFIVQNKLLRTLLMNEPDIANHFKMFEQMDVAFVGLGSSDPEQSMSYKCKCITLDESKALVQEGMSADVCGHRMFIDARPAESFLSDRVISIDLDVLKSIPTVVAVAVGEEKTQSIIASARGKYINVLIIDELAAISVIKTEGI